MLLSGGHQARELLCLVSLDQPPATNTQVDVHLLWGPRDSPPPKPSFSWCLSSHLLSWSGSRHDPRKILTLLGPCPATSRPDNLTSDQELTESMGHIDAVRSSVHPSALPSPCLSHLSALLSLQLSFCHYICPSILHLSIHSSIYLSVIMSVYLFFYLLVLSLHFSVLPSIYVSTLPSFYSSTLLSV